MRRLLIIGIATTLAVTGGCGGKKDQGTDTKIEKEVQGNKKIEEETIIQYIQEYPIDVVGNYTQVSINVMADIKRKEEIRQEEYTGYAKDIEIIGIEDNQIKVKASIENDYFKTQDKQVITYQYQDQEGDNIFIQDAKVEDPNIIVKPTLEFDTEMFYDRKIIFEYRTPAEKFSDRKKVEIELNKENVTNIELDFGGKLSKDNRYGGYKDDFSYNGHIVFTMKDGEKYKLVAYATYMPYEEDDWDKEPYWQIDSTGDGFWLDKIE